MEVLKEILIAALPNVILALIIFVIAWYFSREIKDRIRNSETFEGSVSLKGITWKFISKNLDRAIASQDVDVSTEDRFQALRRLRRSRVVFDGARLLWVDDNPSGNIAERDILARLGVHIDMVTESSSAEKLLLNARSSGKPYHVVISDMDREGSETAGLNFAESVSNDGLFGRTIIYMGNRFLGPIPQYIHGVTNRPNDLFHLIADVLERER